jgi:organic radical activating enzyme
VVSDERAGPYPLKTCARHGSDYYEHCAVCVTENLAAERAEAREKRYPIAPNGIFWSLQGEAHLRGFQMGFVRLGGCSVGCAQCDTDYSVAEKLTVPELLTCCYQTFPHDRDQWVWITGGEPTDHDLRPLLAGLKSAGYSTAVATSGVRRLIPPVDWLSVSPHSEDPAKFVQRYGNEVKLIDGLNDLDLRSWVKRWDNTIDFMYRYVQPMSRKDERLVRHDGGSTEWVVRYVEDEASLERCLAFLKDHPRWALSRQDHHAWAVK